MRTRNRYVNVIRITEKEYRVIKIKQIPVKEHLVIISSMHHLKKYSCD